MDISYMDIHTAVTTTSTRVYTIDASYLWKSKPPNEYQSIKDKSNQSNKLKLLEEYNKHTHLESVHACIHPYACMYTCMLARWCATQSMQRCMYKSKAKGQLLHVTCAKELAQLAQYGVFLRQFHGLRMFVAPPPTDNK